jgi:hypothetical protein
MMREWVDNNVKMTIDRNGDENYRLQVWFRFGKTWSASSDIYDVPVDALVAWFGEDAVKRLEEDNV